MGALELLRLWEDDPRYWSVVQELHPSRGTALAIGELADDALVCMATLAAIVSGRELLVGGINLHGDRIRNLADVAGATATPTRLVSATGEGTWWRFHREQVSA